MVVSSFLGLALDEWVACLAGCAFMGLAALMAPMKAVDKRKTAPRGRGKGGRGRASGKKDDNKRARSAGDDDADRRPDEVPIKQEPEDRKKMQSGFKSYAAAAKHRLGHCKTCSDKSPDDPLCGKCIRDLLACCVLYTLYKLYILFSHMLCCDQNSGKHRDTPII